MPVFGPEDTWVSWSDKLMEYGAEQAKRRSELIKFVNDQCMAK